MALPVEEPREAERIWIEMVRAAGPTRRAELALSLSATVIDMSRAAIRRQHPTWSEHEVAVEFVRVTYGRSLADGVRQKLATVSASP